MGVLIKSGAFAVSPDTTIRGAKKKLTSLLQLKSLRVSAGDMKVRTK